MLKVWNPSESPFGRTERYKDGKTYVGLTLYTPPSILAYMRGAVGASEREERERARALNATIDALPSSGYVRCTIPRLTYIYSVTAALHLEIHAVWGYGIYVLLGGTLVQKYFIDINLPQGKLCT